MFLLTFCSSDSRLVSEGREGRLMESQKLRSGNDFRNPHSQLLRILSNTYILNPFFIDNHNISPGLKFGKHIHTHTHLYFILISALIDIICFVEKKIRAKDKSILSHKCFFKLEFISPFLFECCTYLLCVLLSL